MSDIVSISYTLNTSQDLPSEVPSFLLPNGQPIGGPAPIEVSLNLGLSGNTLQTTIEELAPVHFDVEPKYSSNPVSDVVSTIGTPIVNDIIGMLQGLINRQIQGKTFDIGSIPSVSMELQGEAITLTPSGMKVDEFNNSLMLDGELTVE